MGGKKNAVLLKEIVKEMKNDCNANGSIYALLVVHCPVLLSFLPSPWPCLCAKSLHGIYVPNPFPS